MDELNAALQKVARGTGIIFFGGMVAAFIGFISKTLVARSFERSQYGTFNLALTVISIGAIIALMGLPSGLPREISKYKSEDRERVKHLISAALWVAVPSSIAVAGVYLLIAPYISSLLNDPNLTGVLRVVDLSLPFMAVSSIMVSVSRGFDRVREAFYYQQIIYPVLYLIFVLLAVFGRLGFGFVFTGYVIAQAVIAVMISLDLKRSGVLRLAPFPDRRVAVGLVAFSIPLMLTGILSYIMGWTDTLMLGYYFNSSVVGLYSTASPLAKFIPVFLSSAGFLFMPVATSFYTRGKLEELRRFYMIITRWVFIPTFLLFTLFLVFPRATIGGLFGSRYTAAAPALQILTVGFTVQALFGPNGLSLVAVGRTKANLIGNLIAAALNVTLNAVLIPIYGIKGAALATAVSYIAINLVYSSWLYRRTGVHPFGRSYVIQVIVAAVIVGAMLIFAPRKWGSLKRFS